MSVGRPTSVPASKRSAALQNYYKNRDRKLLAVKNYALRTRNDFNAYVRFRMVQVKGRAKNKSLIFELDHEWAALQPDVCSVTGMPFEILAGGGPLTPSFDRINPAIGYTKSNTRLVCQWFNIAKQDWPDDQIQQLICSAADHIRTGKVIPVDV